MTECYACAKLAELRAENSALHVRVDELECADVSQTVEDTSERVTNQGEMLNDSRDVRIDLLGEESCRQDADQPERVEPADCESDSREKLEADAGELTADYASSGGVCDALYRGIIDLLDRQAAITERHILTQPDERDEQIAELEAKVDELTAQLEAAYAKNRSLRTHISKMQEGRHGWHVKGAELQREVDRLTRENISLARDLGECMAERDGLKRENAKLSDDEFYLRCTLVDMDGEVVG